MKEIWKPVKGYELYYLVSNHGVIKRIVNNHNNRILGQRKNSNGYFVADLTVGNHKVTFRVHRIIAFAFIPNPNNYPHINHKNSVRTDNRLSNLEWCTRSMNMKHAFKQGRCHPPRGNGRYFIANQIKEIRELLKSKPVTFIAKKYKCSIDTIYRIRSNKFYKDII